MGQPAGDPWVDPRVTRGQPMGHPRADKLMQICEVNRIKFEKYLIVNYLKETIMQYSILTNGIIADSISALRHYGITALQHYGFMAYSNYSKKYGNAITVLICKINSTTNYTCTQLTK